MTINGGPDPATTEWVPIWNSKGGADLSYPDQVRRDGASHYWRLNELTGTIALDSIGDKDGTIQGGVTLGVGGALSTGETAMSFNGTPTGRIALGTFAFPLISSYEAWIKTTATLPQNAVVCGYQNAGPYFGAAGNNVFCYDPPSGGAIQGSTPVNTGDWSYLVMTCDGTTRRLYVNGTLEAQRAVTAGAISAYPWFIGASNDNPGNEFPGVIDEVALYPVALSAAQIALHYSLRNSTVIGLPTLPPNTLLGRGSAAGSGPPVQINLGTGLSMAGTVISSTGGGTGGGMDLDYLGNYTTPRTYNDGDIVIGPDGVAYMCVVDGTTTPPEPWPGIGIISSQGPPGPPGQDAAIVADATYWTVSNHATLVNERAMNLLGTGYVRSTGGEPSTVATIPFSDTTGQVPDARLSPNVALKNIDNHFVAQTFASYSTISGANSLLQFNDTTAPADGHYWRFLNYSDGHLRLEALNDAQNALLAQYTFDRAGNLSAAAFYGNGLNLTNLNASNLTSGLVATPRLGSGAANANTFLRGDSTWQTVPGGIPSGLIAMFSTACPVGWTRVAALDNRFPMGSTGYGATGGSTSHYHDLPTLTTDNSGTHTHSFSGSGTASGNTGGDGLYGIMGTPGGGSAFQNFDKNHSHSFSASVSISGTTGGGGAHTHAITGGRTNSEGNIIPPYLTVVFCQKD